MGTKEGSNHEHHLSPHDGARPHEEEGGGHAGGEDDIDCNQQSRVFLPIYLIEKFKGRRLVIQETYDFLIAAHQESFVSVNNVEEPTEKVHDDVEERLDDDRPQLHEPGAAEALLPDQHDVEVEECEEGAKDCEGCEHWNESDIEEILEGWGGEHLGRIL